MGIALAFTVLDIELYHLELEQGSHMYDSSLNRATYLRTYEPVLFQEVQNCRSLYILRQ